MFSQIFGSYLLNKKLISPDQLKDALDYQKNVHLKLGVLAVNSGFMNATEVEKVHGMQAKVDKKFGELAIEMGYLDEEKLQKLLSTQKTGHLLLGQALVDKGYMNLEQFEASLNGYKNEYSLTDEQFKSIQNEDTTEYVNAFFKFNCSESNLYKRYASLLIRNIIRFIDDDFKVLDIISVDSVQFDWLASQEITGEIGMFTAVSANEQEFIAFAGKYAKDNYSVNDEFVKASVGEFLNQHNGLYLVNMSIDEIELELTPQVVNNGKKLTGLTDAYIIPVVFSFGKVDFIISKTAGKIE